ncbi:CopD family protein [Rhizobium calliandrae]|uniref:Protoporphyrinogen IX oxidase n=1 Tax=Rhizobium calliandrae TaxID=1312182 RepID=A0ABT7KLS3_9HYPH|nr:CopD family protein [Rhizobium calliandrae]MDL2409097.1 CopD family protein [Rhizobium calliandrae]
MYLYVKAVHVFAVILFIAGILATAFALRTVTTMPHDTGAARRFGEIVLRWDGLVTTPALAVIWVAGLTMAFGAGWSTSLWLLLKLVPAALLTGLHTIQGIALKRQLQAVHTTALITWAPLAILLAFAAIDWLAVTKPF